MGNVKDVKRKLGRIDRERVEQYLHSVREVEKRLIQKEEILEDGRPKFDESKVRLEREVKNSFQEHVELMTDLIVLAFQTDMTRVCTLKLNNDHGTLRFPHIGVDYMIHHLLSHNDTNDWLKVNQFFLEQMAYIARRMDAIREGERTLLDNSMLMLCSSMITGHHDANQLPVVMLGGGGGRIKGGQNLDYLEKSDRQISRLFLSMMDKMEVRPKTFGDAYKPLREV